jgi:hypothetical protein
MPLKNSFSKILYTSLAVILVFSIGIMSIIGSGGSGQVNGGSDPNGDSGGDVLGLIFDFLFGTPEWFAYRYGVDPWQVLVDPGARFSIPSPENHDNRYSFISICKGRDMRKGTFFEGYARDIHSHTLGCDDTTDTTKHTIGGTINNAFSSHIAIGNMFRNNWLGFSGPSFTYEIEQDNDKPTQADLLMQTYINGLWHYHVVRGLEFSMNPTDISYTPEPSDVGDRFNVGVSAISGLPGYQGISLKWDGFNTKALLYDSILSTDHVELEKLPGGGNANDMYSISAGWKLDSALGTQMLRLSSLRVNPTDMVIDQKPNDLPKVKFTSTNTASLRVELEGEYQNGVSGLNNAFSRFRANAGGISWTGYNFVDPLGPWEISKEAASLIESSSIGAAPMPSDITIYSIFFSNKEPASLYQYISEGRDATPDLDGMDYGYSRIMYDTPAINGGTTATLNPGSIDMSMIRLGVEGMNYIKVPFGPWGKEKAPVLVAGNDGATVMDLASGEKLHDLDASGQFFIGGLGLRFNPQALFMHTAAGGYLQAYAPEDNDFSPFFLLIDAISNPPSVIRDAVPIGGETQAEGLVYVNNTSGMVRFILFDADQDAFELDDTQDIPSNELETPVPGSPISAYVHTTDGPALIVSQGSPGALYFHPRGGENSAAKIGNVGNDPRRIRCVRPVCAVSNFDSDSLTIFTWNGGADSPVFARNIPVGDGPVGIDIVADGENRAIVSTGFNDHTYSITVVGPSGEEISKSQQNVPSTCTNPGHAVFVEDAVGVKIVVSCNTSDTLEVIDDQP